jgi:hypothetical protein
MAGTKGTTRECRTRKYETRVVLVLDHVIWRVLLLLPLSRGKLGACDLAAFLGCFYRLPTFA